jgi:hypothetical protein
VWMQRLSVCIFCRERRESKESERMAREFKISAEELAKIQEINKRTKEAREAREAKIVDEVNAPYRRAIKWVKEEEKKMMLCDEAGENYEVVFGKFKIPDEFVEILEGKKFPVCRMGADMGKDKKTLGDKFFVLKNQKLALTYKDHIDKDKLKQFLKKKVAIPDPKYLECAHENGGADFVPYQHTHVLCDWGRPISTSDCRFFDYEGIHPNIKLITTRSHWAAWTKYIAKEDPENAGLVVEEAPLVQRIWDCKSREEAIMRYVKNVSQYAAVTKIWNERPRVEKKTFDLKLRKWQKWLLEDTRVAAPQNVTEVKSDGDKHRMRRIIWMWDPTGGAGKGVFGDWIKEAYPKMWVRVKALGKGSDGAEIVKGLCDGGWTGHGIIVDLPKSYDGMKFIYESLEALKDGEFTTTKWSGKPVELEWKPHVVVFSNHLPTTWKMSEDRWQIMALVQKGSVMHAMCMSKDGTTSALSGFEAKNAFDVLQDEQDGWELLRLNIKAAALLRTALAPSVSASDTQHGRVNGYDKPFIG